MDKDNETELKTANGAESPEIENQSTENRPVESSEKMEEPAAESSEIEIQSTENRPVESSEKMEEPAAESSEIEIQSTENRPVESSEKMEEPAAESPEIEIQSTENRPVESSEKIEEPAAESSEIEIQSTENRPVESSEKIEEPAAENSEIEIQSTENQPVENSGKIEEPAAESPENKSEEAETGSESEVTDKNNLEASGEDAENLDFSVCSKEKMLEISASLFEVKSFRKTDIIIGKLREEIDGRNREVREQQLKVFLEEGGEADAFYYKNDDLTQQFYDNVRALKKRKTDYYSELEKNKKENGKAKNRILDEIRQMVESESATNKVAERIRVLQQEWKEIGSVSAQGADNLYKSYRALLDRFYSLRNQEHQLMILDRKKNTEIKKVLCDRAEELIGEENINSAIARLNKLHEEYKETGPVLREEQEKLWQRFKLASDKLYEKKRAYIEVLRVKLEANMKVKQELCLKIEEFPDFTSERITDWNKKTKEILAVQKEWEAVGSVPREVAKTLNKQFWANFKAFFSVKSSFFEQLEKQRRANLSLKEELCVEAETLQENIDWDKTAAALKALQGKWREIGPVPEAQRESIYARFKKACDTFFERKRNKSAAKSKEFAENLKTKTEICAKIAGIAPGEKPLETLTGLISEWSAVGFVPKKAD